MSDEIGLPDAVPHADSTRELLALRAPLHASLSPDGARLTLTTSRVPEDSDVEVIELVVVDVTSGIEAPMPGAVPGDRVAEWSPDSARAALLRVRGDDLVLAVADPSSGEVRVLEEVDRVDGSPVWSPRGDTVVVPCTRGTVIDRTRPYRWTRPFPAADGTGPLEDPPQLRLVDVASGRARWLTDDEWRWATPRWSPSGDRLAAVVAGDPDDTIGGQCLRLVDLDGVATTTDIPCGRAVVPVWLADGALVALVVEPQGRPGGSEPSLFVLEGDTVREVPVPGLLGDVYGDCAAELADVYEHVMLARGRSVVVRTTGGGRMGVALVDIDTGGVQTVLDGPRSCSPVGLAGDRLVVTRQSAETYPELAVVDLVEGSASERRLMSFTDRLDPFAVVERFEVRSPDGWKLDAWFLSPRDAIRPAPTVLVVHGGPHFAYGEAFSLDAQALCRAGLGVLYTNPRGSTGYGDAFAHAVHGDWAEGPTRDVLAVVDAAVDRGWVDPARLGVTGNSYGGYLAAWLASTTSRFGAAVIENPVTDLLGMFGTSDIGRRFFPAQLGGQPHEIADVYLAQSPLLQAHQCRTPSLFVTGELDRRCPPGQAWAMHRVLRQLGTPSEVLVLPGASHEGSTYGPPSARLAHDEALVEWMARWLARPAAVDTAVH